MSVIGFFDKASISSKEDSKNNHIIQAGAVRKIFPKRKSAQETAAVDEP